MAATNVPTVAGFAMMAWCKGIAPRLIGYWLTGFSNATFVLGLSLVSGNTGGQTKKSIASAAVFLGVAAGYVLLAFIGFISSPDQISYTLATSLVLSCSKTTKPLDISLVLLAVWYLEVSKYVPFLCYQHYYR